MRIGILTYSREYANLGTIMQAYCTLNAVRSAYPDAQVELIDYAARAPLPKPYLTDLSLHSIAMDCTRIAKYRRFFSDMLTFSADSLTTTDASKATHFMRRQHYDAIYVGSDTVLELTSATHDRLTPYWLDPSIQTTKFMAAASALNLTFEGLSTCQRALIQHSVDAFTLLGVRDAATFRLISRFTSEKDERLQLVPDPTFTYPIDYTHIENYLMRRHMEFTRPVVCLHLLRDSQWAAAVASSFRQSGYVVASLRPARYADLIFSDLSPFEQLGLYKYFSLVITHRFHDTIFCLKNLTPVLAFPEKHTDVTSHGESKLASLLTAFGLDSVSLVSGNSARMPDNILERYRRAVAHFHDARQDIQARLREHSDRYHAFIARSQLCVQ